MSSFKENVAKVKQSTDLVEYISSSGVTLKQRGTNFLGLCPFHNEKTPSFIVNPQLQYYKCFGCGASGDVLSFVEQSENLNFYEALTKLAEDANIEITEIGEESKYDYVSLRACLRDTANFFFKSFRELPETHRAVREIVSRGLSPSAMLYGYAPEGRRSLVDFLIGEGYSKETILTAGVAYASKKTGEIYDFWNGRLIFFITDISGRPIGFSGRKLFEDDKMGKYVNSRETPLFNKSSALFNISKAKKEASNSGTIYVAEGQFDVAAITESGLPNVVASSGTAFTKKQAMMCRRLVSENGRIVFCFDGDEAGQKAAVKVFENNPSIHNQAYVVTLPEGLDPCSYREEYGAEKLAKKLQETQPLLEYVLEITRNKYNLKNDLETSQYINEATRLIAGVSNIVLQERYIKKIALESFTPVDKIRIIVSEVDSTLPSEEDDTGAENHTPLAERVSLVEAKEGSDNKPRITPQEIEEKISASRAYEAAARILVLATNKPKYLPEIKKMIRFLPREFKPLARELYERGDKKIVIEDFDSSVELSVLLEQEFFGFDSIMSERDYDTQLKYLESYLKSYRDKKIRERRRVEILSIIKDSGDQASEFFGTIEELEKDIRSKTVENL